MTTATAEQTQHHYPDGPALTEQAPKLDAQYKGELSKVARLNALRAQALDTASKLNILDTTVRAGLMARLIGLLGLFMSVTGKTTTKEVTGLFTSVMEMLSKGVKSATYIEQEGYETDAEGHKVRKRSWVVADKDSYSKQYMQPYKTLARWTYKLWNKAEDEAIARLNWAGYVEVGGVRYATPVDMLEAGFSIKETFDVFKTAINPSNYSVADMHDADQLYAASKDAAWDEEGETRFMAVTRAKDEQGIMRRKLIKVTDDHESVAGAIVGLLLSDNGMVLRPARIAEIRAILDRQDPPMPLVLPGSDPAAPETTESEVPVGDPAAPVEVA